MNTAPPPHRCPRLTYLLLAVPALLAFLALRTGHLAFKLGVPASCALLVARLPLPPPRLPTIAGLLLAFAGSVVGDAFLSTRAGRVSFYVAGIAGFLVAHLGYIAFSARLGRLPRPALALLLAGYGAWFALTLGPAIASPPLRFAAFAYLVVSCVSLASALGLRQPPLVKIPYLAGIGLILFSDTLIALHDFLKVPAVGRWILPTYYLAQILVVAAATGLPLPSPPADTTRPGNQPMG